MNKFTKADIVDAIYNKTGTSRKEIRDVVDLFIGEIKAALVSRGVIELRGFGTFEIKIRKGRKNARNPKTGEFLTINSHGVAAFRPGRELHQAVWSLKQVEPAGDNSSVVSSDDVSLSPEARGGESSKADSRAARSRDKNNER